MPTITAPPAPTAAKGLAQNAAQTKAGEGVESFQDLRFVAEPKVDGWRMLVHRAEDGVHLYSRNGLGYDGYVPNIEAEIAAAFPVGTWLDTEAASLKVVNGALTHGWNTVQSVFGGTAANGAAKSEGIQLMVFDLISHGGTDARGLPYESRRNLLERIFADYEGDRLLLMPQVAPTAASLDALLAQGFEGMVIKDRNSRYASGKRGKGWTKIKPHRTEDVVITGFKPGEKSFTGLVGAVEFSQTKDGQLVERGRCSGMSMKVRKAMSANPDAWLGKVIEIAVWDETVNGRFRHPQMKRERHDKGAAECVWTVA